MALYILKRFSGVLLTLFVILLVSYSLVRMAPGDPTKSSMLGENSAMTEGISADESALTVNRSLREKLYLDKPIYIGFFFWLRSAILHGDLGDSATVDKGKPVTELILERIPVTLSLNIFAIIITYSIALPVGIYSAVFQNSFLDKGSALFFFILYSIPGFWLALVLQALFCEGGKFPFFPIDGLSSSGVIGKSTWQIFAESAKHYILPVLCLSYAGFAGLSRYARSSMLEIIRQDYIRTARAKGLSESVVIFKHLFRNGLITLITLFAGLLPGLIAGSIIIEYVFNIPGMGTLSMMALTSRDIPVLMALFAFGGGLTLLGILLSDVFYVIADPRISFK
ncbi:MAG: ABC transporter permease [Verrucomicrobiota bacterium]|nr:ABC transporter permease [Verrucomicrobiota bacterium]